MYAETPVAEEKSSLAYENSYIEPPEPPKAKEPERDGVDVASQIKEEPKSTVIKTFKAKTNVNFRLTPDTSRTDNIIGVLKMGEKVSQIGNAVKNGFIQVEYENKKGYIQLMFLEEV